VFVDIDRSPSTTVTHAPDSGVPLEADVTVIGSKGDGCSEALVIG
jgi:hypothetical protein